MNEICSQLINSEDLRIPKIEDILIEYKKGYIYIYSQNSLNLTHIINSIKNFQIEIIKSITYENENVFVYKLLPNIQEIPHQEIVFNILKKCLLKEIKPECKLYYFATLGMTLREILLLRALIKYENQIINFSEFSIIKTVLSYPKLTVNLIEYFKEKFKTKKSHKKIENEIEEQLKDIETSSEDKILKTIYLIIKNSLRSNFYLEKETISFKIATKNLNLKGIQPLVESFVFHQDFSGVHLRNSLVARGGLRWSNRYEDFRDEVKSLMTAQIAKNAIIIPDGAKGGFVIYKDISKEEFKKYYSLYIDALLDLIDNKNEKYPLVKYDEDDYYFVVAADKGTSHMSDTANEIAIKRGYWLKDAFASGGSRGYSHKELGITAKGAWRSVARFFIEKGIDIYQDEISVVGTGSMRGDVFGNGMLINPNIKLIGAISHSEIFIDPNPDPKTAYEERKRLFENSLNWSAYDKSKISKGGGVFQRSQKSIKLSPEIKRVLNIKKDEINGEELAKKLLTAKVDMLYIGGIGTYVKSSEEENIYIGDKENEGVRVNGDELKCFAVCEGGNLGFTHKARIEYAFNGGRINLDSIDNSAGVNTSDYEVNLKILLNNLVDKTLINETQRDEILFKIVDNVVRSVLWNNYFQSLAISLDEIRSSETKNFIKTIEVLEKHLDEFKRQYFAIPKDNEFELAMFEGKIVRPVLAYMLLYAKIFTKKILLESNLIDSPYALHFLFKYFPKSFTSVYENEIKTHPLKREIIATTIANIVINNNGSSFIMDFEDKESFIKKIENYLIVNSLINANDVRFEIYRQDLKEPAEEQYKKLLLLEEVINFSAKWLSKTYKNKKIDPSFLLNYKEELKPLFENFFENAEYLKFISAIIHIKEETHQPLNEVVKLFFLIIDNFHITKILDFLENYKATKKEKILKFQLQELIEIFVINLSRKILMFERSNETIEKAFDEYMKQFNLENLTEEKELKDLTDAVLFVNNLILNS